MRTDDGELVRGTLAGDQAAFAELVNRYRDAACGVAYHYLGGFDDAQDAVQEAFVHAYLRLNQLSDPGKFAPWLRRITANACADLLRQRGDRLISLDEEEARAMSDSEQDPERLAARRVVRQALERLSEKTRLAVTLFYIDGYSHEEVAGFLEVPVNTVRSRLRRAKKQLREEMMDMVTDVLTEGKPDPQFTKQIVDKALRRAEESRNAHAAGDALRHYDEALEAVEKLALDAEQQRLKMDVLWRKGAASRFPQGKEEMIRLYEQSLAIAEALGDRKDQAVKLLAIGGAYDGHQQENRGKAQTYYQKALTLYRELGDTGGQAHCLRASGKQHIVAKEVAQGKPYYEQALSLFEAVNNPVWVVACRTMLNLISEAGEERFPKLIAWTACCSELEQKAGTVKFISDQGSIYSEYDKENPPPPALFISNVFHEVAHLGKFLDASVPIGGGWSGNAFSYSYQPLKATVTVKSDSERVTVPAGTFERCLLTEHVTTESSLPDDAPEREKQLNRKVRCGTRRAWYAPGVGLVQLHVQQAEGAEAMIQLREFSIQGGGDDYLPLAVGNTWTYGWADVLPEYVAKEVYRVATNLGDMWYLENWHYCVREEAS